MRGHVIGFGTDATEDDEAMVVGNREGRKRKSEM